MSKTQPAVEVTDGAVEEAPTHEAEHGVAQVSVQPGHRPTLDPAGESVAHHQVEAHPEPVDERIEVGEVVADVRVPMIT